jgi:hypothetical protein
MLAHLQAKRRKVVKSRGTAIDQVDQDSDHAHFHVGTGSNITSSHASLSSNADSVDPNTHHEDLIYQENYFSDPIAYGDNAVNDDSLDVQEEDPSKSCSGVSFMSSARTSKRNEKSVSGGIVFLAAICMS